jgi:hypothetical protein
MLYQKISLSPSTSHRGHPEKPLELSTEKLEQRKTSSLCEEIPVAMLIYEVQMSL